MPVIQFDHAGAGLSAPETIDTIEAHLRLEAEPEHFQPKRSRFGVG